MKSHWNLSSVIVTDIISWWWRNFDLEVKSLWLCLIEDWAFPELEKLTCFLLVFDSLMHTWSVCVFRPVGWISKKCEFILRLIAELKGGGWNHQNKYLLSIVFQSSPTFVCFIVGFCVLATIVFLVDKLLPMHFLCNNSVLELHFLRA